MLPNSLESKVTEWQKPCSRSYCYTAIYLVLYFLSLSSRVSWFENELFLPPNPLLALKSRWSASSHSNLRLSQRLDHSEKYEAGSSSYLIILLLWSTAGISLPPYLKGTQLLTHHICIWVLLMWCWRCVRCPPCSPKAQ